VIAEAACEHRGSLREAKRLAKAAHAAGADIVKFQLHLPNAEMIPGSIRFWAGSMDEVLDRVNLSIDDHRRLMRYCETIGIQYLCTAYCAEGVQLLQELGVPAFKIGSGEMTNLPMMRRVAELSAKTGKPVLVSTGMSTLSEIDETVAVLKGAGARFMLFNCTSEYPPKPEHINLGLLKVFRERWGVLVGQSDHTPDAYTSYAAVALGARAIEKHFTFSRALRGPDWHVSIEPKELKTLIQGMRIIEAALGSRKRLHPEERPVRAWAHHSVVSLCAIPAGAAIAPDMVGVKRPGSGVPAKHLDAFYGRVARREIQKDALLRWEDVGR
jgi:N-acetylneuraminate synthase